MASKFGRSESLGTFMASLVLGLFSPMARASVLGSGGSISQNRVVMNGAVDPMAADRYPSPTLLAGHDWYLDQRRSMADVGIQDVTQPVTADGAAVDGPVPEPASLGLFGGGLILVSAFIRRLTLKKTALTPERDELPASGAQNDSTAALFTPGPRGPCE